MDIERIGIMPAFDKKQLNREKSVMESIISIMC